MIEELPELRFTLTTALESLQLGGRLIVVTLRRKEVWACDGGFCFFWGGVDFRVILLFFVWLTITYSSDFCQTI